MVFFLIYESSTSSECSIPLYGNPKLSFIVSKTESGVNILSVYLFSEQSYSCYGIPPLEKVSDQRDNVAV